VCSRDESIRWFYFSMTSRVVEIKGSHAIYVSRPDAVATLIEKAAKGVQLASPG